jgi:hypothetical protein
MRLEGIGSPGAVGLRRCGSESTKDQAHDVIWRRRVGLGNGSVQLLASSGDPDVVHAGVAGRPDAVESVGLEGVGTGLGLSRY